MKLALLAIFRNEASHIDEFIRHYIDNGVDHFYLINNASEDDYTSVLNPYLDFITLVHEDRVINQGVMNHHQSDVQFTNYNKLLHTIKKTNTDWLIVCDIDEFIYARRGFKTIKEFLLEKGDIFDQVLIREKVFCSNGLQKQPESVIKGFTARVDYSKHNKCVPKCIAKVKSIDFAHVHYCVLKKESAITYEETLTNFTNQIIRTDKSLIIRERNKLVEYIDEDILSNGYLACNHYYIQSKEWFFGTKAVRGVAALGHDHGDVMADKWLKIWNQHKRMSQIQDIELLTLKETNAKIV